ncbi:MAG TPA: hypothetical protein VLZ81_15735 [Blastocatellia bacterium]|nr:hypothetical protein [Blastocatellia bacterium]
MFDWIGWVATGIFASSYFCKRQAALRAVQAFAALTWIGYGLLIRAVPVVGANVVVAAVAGWSAWREHARPDTASESAAKSQTT